MVSALDDFCFNEEADGRGCDVSLEFIDGGVKQKEAVDG